MFFLYTGWKKADIWSVGIIILEMLGTLFQKSRLQNYPELNPTLFPLLDACHGTIRKCFRHTTCGVYFWGYCLAFLCVTTRERFLKCMHRVESSQAEWSFFSFTAAIYRNPSRLSILVLQSSSTSSFLTGEFHNFIDPPSESQKDKEVGSEDGICTQCHI